jgi:hypothetical protein
MDVGKILFYITAMINDNILEVRFVEKMYLYKDNDSLIFHHWEYENGIKKILKFIRCENVNGFSELVEFKRNVIIYIENLRRQNGN